MATPISSSGALVRIGRATSRKLLQETCGPAAKDVMNGCASHRDALGWRLGGVGLSTVTLARTVT
jgi:hypothetical protein